VVVKQDGGRWVAAGGRCPSAPFPIRASCGMIPLRFRIIPGGGPIAREWIVYAFHAGLHRPACNPSTEKERFPRPSRCGQEARLAMTPGALAEPPFFLGLPRVFPCLLARSRLALVRSEMLERSI
jgi:hypothetical protein